MAIGMLELWLLFWMLIIIGLVQLIKYLLESGRREQESEIKKSKDRQSKLMVLLQKLDDRRALGDIDENNYKQFYEKYKIELDNLKNQLIEKELLREAHVDIEAYKNDEEKKGNIASAFFWMLFLSIILFWLPVVGPLLAGFVGGRKAGSIGNAILAALLPAIIIFFIFATILSPLLSELLGPFLGILLGTTFGGIIGIIILIDSIVLIIGAIIGAITV